VTDQFTALLALGAILSTSLTTATAARYFTAFYKNYIAVYKLASLCTNADDVRQRSDGDHAHIAQVLFLRLCRAYEKQEALLPQNDRAARYLTSKSCQL